MSKVNMFEAASRLKLRFETNRGQLTVEQIWSLGLSDLDIIAQGLDESIRNAPKRSFVTKGEGVDKTTQLKFDIVLYIIETRQVEAQDKAQAVDKAQKAKLLREAIAAKKGEALLSGDVEDLEKRLAELVG